MKSNILIFIFLIGIVLNLSGDELSKKYYKKIYNDYFKEINTFPKLEEKRNKKLIYKSIDCPSYYSCAFKIIEKDNFENSKLEMHNLWVGSKGAWDLNRENGYYVDDKVISDFEKDEISESTFFKYETIFHFNFSKSFFLSYVDTEKRADINFVIQQNLNFSEKKKGDVHSSLFLDTSIMNLFPKKIRILDYIKLKSKNNYYFLLISIPVYDKDREVVLRFHSPNVYFLLYSALVKNNLMTF